MYLCMFVYILIACSNFNLCHTCMSCGIMFDISPLHSHKKEHVMESIELPKDSTTTTFASSSSTLLLPTPSSSSPSKTSTTSTSTLTTITPALTTDSFMKSLFYCTGQQLGV